MIIEKFSKYKKESNESKTKIDYIQPLLDNIEKDYKFKFASSSVYCFGKGNESILIFEQDSHYNIQKMFNNTNKIKSIGGFNIYKINKKLENPFFNDNNQLLESHFYFLDNEYFKKIKYFIFKIMNIADELNHYPVIKWDSNRIVEIKIFTHKSTKLEDLDYILAERISEIWYNLID